MKRGRLLVWTLLLAFTSCSPISKNNIRKHFDQVETQLNGNVGFALFDPKTNEYLVQYNSDHYFTPASNTKIFTFYTSIKLLGDSIPSLFYEVSQDSVIVWGAGDPTFLYQATGPNSQAMDFLREIDSTKILCMSNSNDQVIRYGPGWSWEDYDETFAVERSAFPVYGNRVTFNLRQDTIEIQPPHFQQAFFTHPIKDREVTIARDLNRNFWTIEKSGNIDSLTFEKPFITSSNLVGDLLQDTLHRPVSVISRRPTDNITIFNSAVDTLYRLMMQESDNYIAEQLLILCSTQLGDTLSSDATLKYAVEKLYADLPDKPKIMDGSGLSRYNLVTPRSIVTLWSKISAEMDQHRLFSLVVAGGKNGTLKNGFGSDVPYIYGKTGTLTGVRCLSGFINTRKRGWLIFSYMNGNYTRPVREVNTLMEQWLSKIRNEY